MTDLIIATGANTGYIAKIEPYLRTVSEFYSGKKILFHVTEQGENLFDDNTILHGFESAKMPSARVLCPNPNTCIQHGAFIFHPCLWDCSPDTVLLFMDGDILMQRPFSQQEEQAFSSLKDGQFFLGYNEGPQDNLLTEAGRLNTTLHKDAADELNFYLWGQLPCYNTGILAATVSSWLKLYSGYIKYWNIVDRTFGHYAKQQWLINYLIGTTPGFSFVVMPYSMHTHGHFSTLPQGTHLNNYRQICSADGQVVLFRHKL